MNKILLLILAILLSGCESTVNESINGISRPSDLEPNPWPEPAPQKTTVPDTQTYR